MGAYESGQYRNLFKEIGQTDAEIQQEIEDENVDISSSTFQVLGQTLQTR